MIATVEYSEAKGREWDEFIARAKNGSFLFYRGYMDYHADRFTDRSLMFYENDRLLAVMPANVDGDAMISHGGLTFGGVVSDSRMTTTKMRDIFAALRAFACAQQLKRIRYKAIPHFYHMVAAEEDQYCLFINNAKLVRRDVSSLIVLEGGGKFSKGKRYGVAKAKRLGLKVDRSPEFERYMKIVREVVKAKYGVEPVHTGREMAMLAERFPDHIKLFATYERDDMIAGVIVYESHNVAHVQYMASSDFGKESGALDAVVDYLVNEYYRDKRYFEFGISTERDGHVLNETLVAFKEMFGARAVVYDQYDLTV